MINPTKAMPVSHSFLSLADSTDTHRFTIMQDPSRPAPPPFYHQNGGQPPPPAASAAIATGYPYAAQQQYYNTTYPPPRSYASRSFFRAFFATMICLAVVFGVVLIITWLVLRPSLPHFTLHSLSVSNLSSTSQSLSATWHLSFLVRNGNKKMTVSYNALRSSIFYRQNYISESQLAPFRQDTRSQTTLNATLTAAGTYLEPKLIDNLNAERNASSVLFDVQVVAATSFRSGSWRFRTRVLKVLCRKVPVGVSSKSSSGDLVGGDRECQVWT
ncbi:hypothetical protein AAZX31_13G295100 [Glycine max]|uniref:Uncharacterized protein n=2 Tax=Glycine subgen. Soja TaxID=1462606 RepID=K7M2Z0_SOYBN|nr:NDR1/HIN1-like protein 10 [Glycine max]XP_028186186.1 NDR1/HIN1-like protein 10 [Glycine soja]KAG4972157.1 hypothetical protein JHK85_038578 [Glycine max]KAH1104295.1 hypothetical protein GYH30_037950 [Glycine max]KAH1218846.1 NDR1/HIN1-like protein 13 [Glycine max]KRH22642.1 hypothetical protein GLYMA_13G313600v4 [Glycine max]RZB83767.1 NDR1/HIN1-like protein 13 [Glycine soja]|eukprot:XP_003543419.1 NDR1/HIN1-like protein 10 [Glycine max]